MRRIILFDGKCNLCARSVQFIIKRDPEGCFAFTSIQSESGQKIFREHHIPENTDSLVLIDGNKCYFKSSAALRICKHLKGFWKLLYFLIVIPKPVRDSVYEHIAKNRYAWFGKQESCLLPSPEIRKRFL